MRKRQFQKQPTGLTVADIATLTGGVPADGVALDRVMLDVASLDRVREVILGVAAEWCA